MKVPFIGKMHIPYQQLFMLSAVREVAVPDPEVRIAGEWWRNRSLASMWSVTKVPSLPKLNLLGSPFLCPAGYRFVLIISNGSAGVL